MVAEPGSAARILSWIIVALASLLTASCEIPARPPSDEELISAFRRTQSCYDQMAKWSMSVKGVEQVYYEFQWVTDLKPGGFIDDPAFWRQMANDQYRAGWRKCLYETGVTQVVIYGDGVKGKGPEANQVWFWIFWGLTAGGQTKGIVYDADDSLEHEERLEPSITEYGGKLTPKNSDLKPNQKIFRKIIPHWYLWYEYN